MKSIFNTLQEKWQGVQLFARRGQDQSYDTIVIFLTDVEDD